MLTQSLLAKTWSNTTMNGAGKLMDLIQNVLYANDNLIIQLKLLKEVVQNLHHLFLQQFEKI